MSGQGQAGRVLLDWLGWESVAPDQLVWGPFRHRLALRCPSHPNMYGCSYRSKVRTGHPVASVACSDDHGGQSSDGELSSESGCDAADVAPASQEVCPAPVVDDAYLKLEASGSGRDHSPVWPLCVMLQLGSASALSSIGLDWLVSVATLPLCVCATCMLHAHTLW